MKKSISHTWTKPLNSKQWLLLLLSFLLLNSDSLNAQVVFDNEDEYAAYSTANIQSLESFIDYYQTHKGLKSTSEYVIPTVVHVIHNNGVENISDAVITDAIALLNEQFNGNFGGYDCDIEFRLAKIDPDGNCTSGITRTVYGTPQVVDVGSEPGYVSELTIKNLIRWPIENYLNIWIVKSVMGDRDFVDGTTHFVNTAIISRRPDSPQWTEEKDGILIQYSSFGDGTFNGMDSPGMTAFCAGTYLNLINVWGVNPIQQPACCVLDEEADGGPASADMINDTPPCNYYAPDGFDNLLLQMADCSPMSNCDNPDDCFHPLGSPEIPNPPDGFPKDNYMCYNWPCQNKFTQGQAQWMWNAIDVIRPDLCSFPNLLATGVLNEIPTSTTWNAGDFVGGNVFIGQTITVASGGVLTINAGVTAHFRGAAKLVIEPGGKVIVNGATLTNFCEIYWPGIEVWGQSTQRQLATYQGILELKNGAIVEHADCGVRLGNLVSTNPWTYDWGKTGGIVKATTNSIFRNNKKDVEFLAYQNYQIINGAYTLKKNVSYFYDTEFLVDEALPTVTNLSQRVSLYDVDGIRFRSCNFHIEDDALTNYSIQNRGYGIYSLVSSFEVNGRCSVIIPLGSECDPGYLTAETLGEPGSDIIPSQFSNYLTAIRSVGPDGFSTTSVTTTIFRGNEMGIFLKTIEQASIYRNRFFIDDQNYFIAFGAHLLGCTGYKVERNIFEGTGDLEELNTGIWISDSDDESNEIYLNDFSGLIAGTIAQGIQEDVIENHQGLEILCGLYENGKYNISVVQFNGDDGKIALRQGEMAADDEDETAPAGNLFTHTDWGMSAPYTDYFICPDDDCDPIIYEHHNETSVWPVVPLQIDPLLVETSDNLPQFTTRQAACPIDKGIPHTPGHLHSLVLVKRLEIEAIKGELEGLIDGGNTLTVQSFVNNGNNSSSAIRANLLSLAPYLSDEVLRSLLTRQPAMNPWHLCEILIACSPLKPDMFIEVENANLLSDFLFGLLSEYQSGTNGLDSRESALKQAELEKANALNSFIRTRITEDEENYYLEEVKELMTGDDINREIKKKVAILRQENYHPAAVALLASYDENPDNDVWKQFMEVLLDIDAAGGYHAATSSHIATLETLAASGKNGRQHASALLEVLTGVVPLEEYNLPGGGGGLKSLRVRESMRKPSLVGVYPNPAVGEFYITYVLPTERESAMIHIFDLQGKLVQSENVTSGYGILNLNAKQFASGSYVFELELNGQKVAAEKFQIVE